MTRYLILFFLIICFSRCNRSKEVVLSRFKNGNVKEQFIFDKFSNGDTTGLLKGFFKNGKLEVIGRLKNGKREGKWVQYSSEGDTIWEGAFKSEILNGEIFSKHIDGSWEKINYVNGIKEGKGIKFRVSRSNQDEITSYYLDGQYSNNKAQGLWVKKGKNGVILIENTFIDGIIRGYFTNRYANGVIKLKGELNIDSAGNNKFDFYDEFGKRKKLNSYRIELITP